MWGFPHYNGFLLTPALQFLSWWAASNELHNKEVHDEVYKYKQEEVYMGRNVDDLLACDVSRSNVEVKKEELKVEQVDKVGKKVQEEEREERLLAGQTRGGENQVESMAELRRGAGVNKKPLFYGKPHI